MKLPGRRAQQTAASAQRRKFWITNGHEAEVVVVLGQTDAAGGSKGITARSSSRKTCRIQAAQKIGKLGMRVSPTSELWFRGLRGGRRKRARAGRRRGQSAESGSTTSATGSRGPARHHAGVPRRGDSLRPRSRAVRQAIARSTITGQSRRHVRALQSARAYTYAVARLRSRGRPRATTPPGRSCWRARTPSASPGGRSRPWAAPATPPTGRIERYLRDAKLLAMAPGTNGYAG